MCQNVSKRFAFLPLTLSIVAAIVATIMLCPLSGAQNASQIQKSATGSTYRFEDYPVSNVYVGKVRLPDFRGRDKKSSMFRTRIIEGMGDGANFAGKYNVIQIGCGTGCRSYPVAD